ncbi:MAG: tellurium resistance protein TehB [Nitratiruptor sp.]|nr:tellurium resistance protein TehB [Nitratiruptor sp.]NPA83332.1 methyltransferase domain-containing protein [Campylobacterota bacterium]
MEERAKTWNQRYKRRPTPPPVNQALKHFYRLAPGPRALDIACGMGQNAKFLAQQGFLVDAVDIAWEGLRRVATYPGIRAICTDIRHFHFKKNYYDLILCTNFLERSIVSQIVHSLKEDGILIYESFTYRRTDLNSAYLLRKNELLFLFHDLEILYYQLHRERALLVATKA